MDEGGGGGGGAAWARGSHPESEAASCKWRLGEFSSAGQLQHESEEADTTAEVVGES